MDSFWFYGLRHALQHMVETENYPNEGNESDNEFVDEFPDYDKYMTLLTLHSFSFFFFACCSEFAKKERDSPTIKAVPEEEI